jgi:hypothetical protein
MDLVYISLVLRAFILGVFCFRRKGNPCQTSDTARAAPVRILGGQPDTQPGWDPGREASYGRIYGYYHPLYTVFFVGAAAPRIKDSKSPRTQESERRTRITSSAAACDRMKQKGAKSIEQKVTKKTKVRNSRDVWSLIPQRRPPTRLPPTRPTPEGPNRRTRTITITSPIERRPADPCPPRPADPCPPNAPRPTPKPAPAKAENQPKKSQKNGPITPKNNREK